MGGIGIVWEYLIQYGNAKTGMVTKLPFEYKIRLTNTVQVRCQNNVRGR